MICKNNKVFTIKSHLDYFGSRPVSIIHPEICPKTGILSWGYIRKHHNVKVFVDSSTLSLYIMGGQKIWPVDYKDIYDSQ